MFEVRTPLAKSEIMPRCRHKRSKAGSVDTVVLPARAAPSVSAELLSCSGLHWSVQLHGDVEALVEYDARRVGVELVRVNSRVVCREGTFWGYNGRFRFTIPGAGSAAEMVIRTSLWSAVTEFLLRVDGVTVFACESEPERRSLPLPARCPASSRAELPLPHPK